MTRIPHYTPALLASQWRCDVHKVLDFIRACELIAINLNPNLAGRPRWIISPEAVEAFEARRSTVPPIKTVRRAPIKRAWKQYA